MAEKEFMVLTNEEELVLIEIGTAVERESEIEDEDYPPWLDSGDWLAAGEKFRSQAILRSTARPSGSPPDVISVISPLPCPR